MKKLFLNFTMVLVATSLMLVSCNTKTDGDGVDDPNDSIPAGVQEDLATVLKEQGYTLANAAFGTAYPIDSYIYVTFANEADTVAILFNTDGEETLPVSEYVMDETTEYLPGTWDPEYSSWWNAKIAEETEDGEYYFSEGTVSVEKSGRNYAVKIDFVDVNDNPIKWAYVGQIELEVWDGYPDEEFYGEDEEATESTFTYNAGEADFYGDAFGLGLNVYVLYLSEKDEAANIWNDVTLYALTNATATAESFPTGTYAINSTYEESTMIPGYFDSEYANNYGNVAYGFTGAVATEGTFDGYNAWWYLVDGEVTVNLSDDGSAYEIEGSTRSANGSVINFSYTGAISITDKTSSDAATSSVKSVKPVKQGKKLGRRVVRK